MIAVDTILLIYAHRRDSPWHQPAFDVIKSLAEAHDPWAIPWPCIHEFYAVVTKPNVYKPASTLDEALKQIEKWLKSPSLRLLSEGPGYFQALQETVAKGKIIGSSVHDAKIAAICLSNGVRELWSADRDFTRMPRLKVRNPLI